MLGSRSVIHCVLFGEQINSEIQIRPTDEELKEMGPEFNALWDRYFKNKPDKPVM